MAKYNESRARRLRLARNAAALAGAVLLLHTLAGRGGRALLWGGASLVDPEGVDDVSAYGGYGYALGAGAGGPGRRPLQPGELCGWETSVDSSSFDGVVEKEGWPTRFEQLVAESRALKPVFCPVCGASHQAIKFGGQNVREEGRCPKCSSFNRLRQMADAALPEARRMTGRNLQSLNELALTELAIYNTQCAGVLHNILQAAPGYVCSEFVSAELASGTVVKNNVRHEDLQRTSFKDNTFDLVLSTEMLSRVASPYQAHHEVQRILKPGGSHVFTAPFTPTEYHDDIRASVEEGRLVHHIEPPIYTGDRLHPKGVLLFTIFGRETVDKMCMMGFNVTALRLHNGAHGIIGENAWVFVTTKPGGGVLQTQQP